MNSRHGYPGFLLLGALALAACDDSAEVRQARERAERELREAMSATGDLIAAQRERWRETFDARLAKLREEMKELEPELEAASAEARAKSKETLVRLEREAAEARDEAQKWAAAHEDEFEEFRQRADAALEELAKGIENAYEKLKD